MTFSTTREEARALIARAMAIHPRLGDFGFGIYNEDRELLKHGQAFVDEKLAEERSALERSIAEVQAAAEWIKGQERDTGFNPRHSSYGYKHFAERWCRNRGTPAYISNGAFIAAAVGLGWRCRHEDGPNVFFEFHERTIGKPYAFQAACVYFIQAGESAIKIGRTVDVTKRLDQLRTGNHLPLIVRATIDVASPAEAFELERKLHKRFRNLRLEGEWFHWDDSILDAIDEFAGGEP